MVTPSRTEGPLERDILVSVGLLTFAAALVAQFAAQGVTLFLREAGVGSEMLGLLYLAAVPYTLRFVWAPLIDRTRGGAGGRYRPWTLGAFAIVATVLVGMAAFDPGRNPGAIIALVGVAMVALGTVQTALAGLLVEGLQRPSHPKGASMQAAVSALAGVLLGFGVLYLLAPLGWRAVVLTLFAVTATLLAIAIVALDLRGTAEVPPDRPTLLSQLSIFRSPAARRLLLMAVTVAGGVLVPYALKSILLIDAGFSISQAGLIGLVFGNAAGMAGALALRPAVERFGGQRVLAGLGAGNAVVALAIAATGPGPVLTVALILYANFAVFGAYTASRAILMGFCRPGRQATDMASFVSMEAILYLLLAGGVAGALDAMGLGTLLVIGAALSSIGGVLALVNPKAKDRAAHSL